MSKFSLADIDIRTELKPGDLGYIMHRHGKLYAEEYGHGIAFETYVGLGLHEFYKNYDAAFDRVWLAMHDQLIVGSIFLEHRENNTAQLRYLLVEPAYRGIGFGNKLMELYMDFLLERGYTSSYLCTTHELRSAAALYTKFGFKLTEEKESTAFGKRLIEQRYELTLSKVTIQ